ncbi:DUF2207 domain-containing protein [Herbiconiux sp. L3-i23]|uniref:DUF2207 family protein n=1 Tax=Herbiconiux sp. L3-i23 TaxID=2905871 RepID=UPI00205B2276|nr:DUF2207 domain-containing protein [Herbiconiux sp. L3-i23]BDI22082.1 hypothetical protein L3i23_08580 [Herbiconiux sp. L3-i23]
MTRPALAVLVRRLTITAALGAFVAGLVAVAATPPAAAAAPRDVDDFTFSSFDAQYTLGRDADGHSTLRAVETLVAQFPDTDQNRGIRRAVPKDYDGHPTDLRILSVTDGEGEALDYDTDSDDGFEVVTIAADDFVHGERTYVITYEQTNITRAFEDEADEEFYWDVNGTGWAQRFDRVTATVRIGSELAPALTGRSDCAAGASGATGSCRIASSEDAGDTVVTAEADGLAAGETLSFAVGFEEGTFVPRDSSIWSSQWSVVLVLGLVLLVLAVGGGILARVTVLADARGRATVIPEYLPPAEPELPVLAMVLRRPTKAVAATLISFAVRGFARIVQDGSDYQLEYQGPAKPVRSSARADLGPIELRIARAFFGSTFTPGERADLSGGDEKVGPKIHKAVAAARTAAVTEGYMTSPASAPVAIVWILGIAATVSLFLGSVGLLADARGGALPVVTLVLAAVPIVPVLLVSRRPLTARGAEARDHLRGMRDYLQLAEEDRLRVLQSVEGAERSMTGDGDSVIRLYERLLPYAVLLGVEKSWAGVLARAYETEETAPGWYAGRDAFSSATFAASIGAFSSSTVSHFSGSAASSSSGGTGGGISAGGGGGGGGGGGV